MGRKAARAERRFDDPHGRVIAHLASGGVVATLASKPVRGNDARPWLADVFVCGARVASVCVSPYFALLGKTVSERQEVQQGRGKRGGKGARHGER